MKQLLFLPLFFCLFSKTITAATPGLTFSYYEGTWNVLPDFNTLTPVKTGVVSNISLDERNKENKYAFLWQGFITIPTDGDYTFETNSDDGSKLYLGAYKFDASPIVNNDGEHATRFIKATITLTAGVYPISITYFQQEGGHTMEAYWSSTTGIARQKINDNVLTVEDPGISGLTYSYYEGTWDTLPDFRTIKPVKSGVATNINLDARNRNLLYAFIWQGNITIPAAGDYTFETYSDDGSKLYIGSYDINAQALVDNDFEHYNKLATGTMFLNAGVYPIAVTFFQKLGGDIMEVYWSSNTGIARQRIPDSVFGGRRPAPTSGSSDGLTSATNNYHFSSSTGNDSYTPQQALDPATPWRTIDKLNSFIPDLLPGDAVLFKRDDVFDGNIVMSKSGTIGLPIIFSAYGTGNKPVINGLTALGNWIAAGNGVWEADCNSGAFLNMVVVNGKVKGMGRYPNYSAPNKGYLTYESHADSTQITDNEFDGSVNWIGAELVVRKNDWVLDRGVITNQVGHTLTFKSPTAHEPKNNFGFFIQNSPLTLDETGEWYYNPSTKKIMVYFGSDNPNNYSVKASIADTLLLVNNQNYITFDNMAFQGADVSAVRLKNSSYINVQNSAVDFTGFNGINAYLSPYFIIENNTVNHSNNTGIKLDSSCYFALVRNNTVKNSGLIPGMGGSNNQQYDGIFSESTPSNIFELNTVDSSGYCGITFTGDLTVVKNNFVNHFCLILNDGGGIYTWGGWNVTGRIVSGNVVLNGMGAPEGTSSTLAGGAVGIYLDDRSTNIDISNNTVANCSRAGIIIHNSHEINTNGNTLYNNNIQLSIVHDDLEVADPIRNMAILNNILFTTNNNQFLMENVSSLNDLESFGSYDFNYYARPMNMNGTIYTNIKVGSEYKSVYYNVAQWNARTGYDQHSFPSPVRIPAYKVNYITGPEKYPNGTFNSNINGVDIQSSPGVGTASFNSGGKLDGGALQVSFDASSGATNNVAIYLALGSVTAGRNYLIKFSQLGSGAPKTMKAFILQNGAPWGRLSDLSFFEFSTTRTENEFVFTAPSTESSIMLAFETSGPDSPYWLDNFSMTEADITFTNPDDYVRFEYNGTNKPKNIFLDGSYLDVKNNFYSGNITLNAFSSLVLMKQGSYASQPVTNQSSAAQIAEMRKLEAVDMTLNVSPNPVKDKLLVAVSLPEGTRAAAISIHSLAGVKLKTQAISPNANTVGIDVSALSSGVYLMNITFDGHVITKKFVK